MYPAPRSILVVLVLVSSIAAGPKADDVAAQPHRRAPSVWAMEPGTVERSLDEQLLRRIYGIDASAFRAVMRGADGTAYPVFVGAPVIAWGAWLVQGRRSGSDAYRLTVSQAATYGAVVGLKALFRRPRPYATLPDIHSRSTRYSPMGSEGDSFAFPSGHAAMSFAIVTSWSLSHPKWYVIGPGVVWASAVSLSRVWLGVHYPSDVLVGALLGTALAAGGHLLGASIIPGVLQGSSEQGVMPVVHVQIRL